MKNSTQAVTGFKVRGYRVKKTKEGDKVCVSLEALVDDIGSGKFGLGSVLNSLLQHQVGDCDIGISLFMSDSIIKPEDEELENKESEDK